ncbi:glycosyltransferase family 4 protein [candidate division WWE3 bacterium]|nr:glycosyltransferase family 4 protein [candidate division WWE3 bacterium]
MNILFVSPYYKPYFGGIERVIEKLGQQFIKLDHATISVLTSRWSFPRHYEPTWPETEHIDYEDIYRLHSFPSIAPPFFQVPLVWFSPHEINKILDAIKPDAIQLMSDRWFWVNYWVLRWAKKNHVPTVFSLSFHSLSKNQKFLRPINHRILPMANWIHAITEHEKHQVASTYSIPDSQIKVIPWGIQKNNEDKKEINQVFKIISVGRISKHKGQLWLAQQYLEADLKKPTELILIGAIEEPLISEQIKILPIPEHKSITITGEVSEKMLAQAYQTADLFVLFPEYEAFGLVFLEAMIQGIPVLTHNVGAIQEVLKENAMVVEKYDSSSAKINLEQLVNNDQLRNELGQKGKKYVENTYSWQQTAEQFLSLYKNHE